MTVRYHLHQLGWQKLEKLDNVKWWWGLRGVLTRCRAGGVARWMQRCQGAVSWHSCPAAILEVHALEPAE